MRTVLHLSRLWSSAYVANLALWICMSTVDLKTYQNEEFFHGVSHTLVLVLLSKWLSWLIFIFWVHALHALIALQNWCLAARLRSTYCCLRLCRCAFYFGLQPDRRSVDNSLTWLIESLFLLKLRCLYKRCHFHKTWPNIESFRRVLFEWRPLTELQLILHVNNITIRTFWFQRTCILTRTCNQFRLLLNQVLLLHSSRQFSN